MDYYFRLVTMVGTAILLLERVDAPCKPVRCDAELHQYCTWYMDRPIAAQSIVQHRLQRPGIHSSFEEHPELEVDY